MDENDVRYIKPRSKSQDIADCRRPWVCPLCGRNGMLRSATMFLFLDPHTGSERNAMVCWECSPRNGDGVADGLVVRQRTKKH